MRVALGGTFEVVCLDESGRVMAVLTAHNTITSDGYSFLCDALVAPERPHPMSYIAVGRSSPPEGIYSRRLGDEVTRQIARYTKSPRSVVLEATFPQQSSITECGIFNAPEGGTMFCYAVFDAISAPLLAVRYTIVFE